MKLEVREMIFISLFAALTAVGAFIKIPTPMVPFTLQFLFCAYSGLLLGGRLGFFSQCLYIFIGLIGIPIFTNGGGPAYVLQPTFGFLIGFAFCSLIAGSFVDRTANVRFWPSFAVLIAGLMVVYIFGVSYLYMIVNYYLEKEMSLMTAIMVGFAPYILFDVLQGALIALSAVRIIPILRRAGYLNVSRTSPMKTVAE